MGEGIEIKEVANEKLSGKDFVDVLNRAIEMAEISDNPVTIDPFSMGIGSRIYEELTPAEKNMAKRTFLSELGLTEENLESFKTREYLSIAPEGATSLGRLKFSFLRLIKKRYFYKD